MVNGPNSRARWHVRVIERVSPRWRPLVIGLVLWVICTALAIGETGFVPRTDVAWVVTLAIGPLVLVVGSILGELAILVIKRGAGLAVLKTRLEDVTRHNRVSVARIALQLLFFGVLFAAILAAARSWEPRASSDSWFHRNFKQY